MSVMTISLLASVVGNKPIHFEMTAIKNRTTASFCAKKRLVLRGTRPPPEKTRHPANGVRWGQVGVQRTVLHGDRFDSNDKKGYHPLLPYLE